MRYYKKLNVYKTQNMVFDPVTVTATTRDRWCFCKEINGVVIFNAVKVNYQITSQQKLILNMLKDKGIDCFMIEYFMGSLDGDQVLEGIIASYNQAISLLTYQMERQKDKTLSQNEIKNLQQVITVLRSLDQKAS